METIGESTDNYRDNYRNLSHSVITFQKAQSHISMVLFVADESTVLANVAFRTGL